MTTEQSLLVVTNASAGSAQDEAVESALDVLRDGLGTDAVDVQASKNPDDLTRILAAADGRRVVPVGGDGSLHAVVAALHASGALSGTPLGLVPLGTGNDMARSLGLPLEPADAARVVLQGRDRPLDLIVDDEGGVVVNAVHLGVGAQAAEEAGAAKERLGSAGYAVGAVKAGLAANGWAVRVAVDGRQVVGPDRRSLMIALANGRTIGGGTELAPDAEPDDGLIDVVVSHSTGALAKVGYAAALRRGTHVDRDDVVVARGREVTVDGEALSFNADGEVGGPIARRTWSLDPAAWTIRVPG